MSWALVFSGTGTAAQAWHEGLLAGLRDHEVEVDPGLTVDHTASARSAFGFVLVVVLAADAAATLDDDLAQLRAGGSHVRVVTPAEGLSAAAGYAQGTAMATEVAGWLDARPTLRPILDAEDLAARFSILALRKAEWTHYAHLAVGTWHVDRYGAAEALPRLRDGIRKLNESHGGANTATAGYHETITAAYVLVLAQFLETCPPGLTLNERVARLMASPLVHRDVLFKAYSRERLLSPDARAGWVEPDLAPLRLDVVLGSTHAV